MENEYYVLPLKCLMKRFRRALCNKSEDPSALFIIESNKPFTLTEFAATIQPHCLNAVNLDTGDFAFCKINNKYKISLGSIQQTQTNELDCRRMIICFLLWEIQLAKTNRI